jgi:hypothetical protein
MVVWVLGLDVCGLVVSPGAGELRASQKKLDALG